MSLQQREIFDMALRNGGPAFAVTLYNKSQQSGEQVCIDICHGVVAAGRLSIFCATLTAVYTECKIRSAHGSDYKPL